jgi:hypothetical protein
MCKLRLRKSVINVYRRASSLEVGPRCRDVELAADDDQCDKMMINDDQCEKAQNANVNRRSEKFP